MPRNSAHLKLSRLDLMSSELGKGAAGKALQQKLGLQHGSAASSANESWRRKI